jgi:hypothetical protein
MNISDTEDHLRRMEDAALKGIAAGKRYPEMMMQLVNREPVERGGGISAKRQPGQVANRP